MGSLSFYITSFFFSTYKLNCIFKSSVSLTYMPPPIQYYIFVPLFKSLKCDLNNPADTLFKMKTRTTRTPALHVKGIMTALEQRTDRTAT